jgi:hypothetical protein
MPTKPLKWTLISALATLTLAACSGGADPSPTDEPQIGSASEPLMAAPAGSAAAADRKHCDGRKGRGHMDPTAFVKHFDANGDGKLAVSELPERMQAWLAPADTNKDGFLTTDELAAAKATAGKERFAKSDTNGDGALTEAEVGPERWARLSVADADKNGSVTEAEIAQAIQAGTLSFPHHHHHSHGDDAPAPATTGS